MEALYQLNIAAVSLQAGVACHLQRVLHATNKDIAERVLKTVKTANKPYILGTTKNNLRFIYVYVPLMLYVYVRGP